LQQAHSSGQFTYINAIAAPYDWTDAVTTETNNPNTAALHGIANANPFSLPTKSEDKHAVDPLESLFRLVERHVSTQDPRSVCLIFDNLSALSPVVGEDSMILFVQSCCALVEEVSNTHQNSSCVVALTHTDVDELLVSSLSHTADLVMKVDGFKTGYSNEEDGQVRSSAMSLERPNFPICILTPVSSSHSSPLIPSSIATISHLCLSTNLLNQASTSESFESESAPSQPRATSSVSFVLASPLDPMQGIKDYVQSVLGLAQKQPRIAAMAAAGATFGLLALAGLNGCFTKKWDVKGKVVVITGASSGIGKSLALHLVGMGALYVALSPVSCSLFSPLLSSSSRSRLTDLLCIACEVFPWQQEERSS